MKRFVASLREVQLQAARALLRFETPPGHQSQIDGGQATVPFRAGPTVGHVFVLTLGFSRRGFYYVCADERLAQFLEAHERAVAYFGGHTREHFVWRQLDLRGATNRYSVPVRFIGQRVEVQRRGETVYMFHRDQEIATHPVLPGQHQFRILPERGPGSIARTPRQRRSTVSGAGTPQI